MQKILPNRATVKSISAGRRTFATSFEKKAVSLTATRRFAHSKRPFL
jgi:hypothetical protein